MRVLILIAFFAMGVAWRHSDELRALVWSRPLETPAERAEIMKIPAAMPGDEMASRKALMTEVYLKALSRDFAWLDAKEISFREEGSRTPDGVWKLELFYNAMWFTGAYSPSPDCSDSAEGLLAEWRRASPNSPAPYIVAAQRLLDKGWCFRGSGYAKNVDFASWKPFNDNVDAAYELLETHKSIASVDPQFYVVMASIYVAQGRSDSEFQELLKEGAAKQPYYYRLYEEAYRYYEPQWFGGYSDEEAVAKFAVDQTRSNDRSSAFARVYWSAMDCGCLPPPSIVDKKALRRAMHDLVELYPTAWNVSHMARMACEIEDPELARSYFNALPAGDDGKAGWSEWYSTDIPRWQACRATAGLPANA